MFIYSFYHWTCDVIQSEKTPTCRGIMERIEFDRSKLEDTFKMAENSLFSEPNIHWLQYEKPFICQNHVEVFDLIKNVAIVYCIWISDGLHLKPIYIGHSSAKLAK